MTVGSLPEVCDYSCSKRACLEAVRRPVRAMDWPVSRGDGSKLATRPAVAWLQRRISGQHRFSHKSERFPLGAEILSPAAPPALPRTWGTGAAMLQTSVSAASP
jgi:hypothetical protein